MKNYLDLQINNLIDQEFQRQSETLNLIASENYPNPAVLKAQANIFSSKYAEGYPKKRYYAGCQVIDELENIANLRLQKLFKAEYTNVQPHSGSQANMAAYAALLNLGDTVLAMSLNEGGHLTHGHPVNFSGKLYQPFFYTVKKDTGLIDYEMLEEKARTEKPKLIICGASAYSRDIDYARIRKVADEINAFVWCDMAHPAGFIAKGLLSSPFDHCHFVTSTTHKTLRGPRGGIILMKKDFENPFDKFQSEF